MPDQSWKEGNKKMLEQQTWNSAITLDIVMEATERQMFGLDNPGFCLICGEEQEGCEPDARDYDCESCEAPAVYGAQELFLYMAW